MEAVLFTGTPPMLALRRCRRVVGVDIFSGKPEGRRYRWSCSGEHPLGPMLETRAVAENGRAASGVVTTSTDSAAWLDLVAAVSVRTGSSRGEAGDTDDGCNAGVGGVAAKFAKPMSVAELVQQFERRSDQWRRLGRCAVCAT